MHLCLFFRRKPLFSSLSFISCSFKSLCQNCSLWKVHNHALSWCHIFTWFSHNRHDHARIRVLVNIFSIRSSSLKKNILLFITSVILIFKGKVKNHTRWKWKTREWTTLSLPSPFPSPRYDYRPPSPPKTLWLNSGFFVPNIRL